jgi:hypothetical protein
MDDSFIQVINGELSCVVQMSWGNSRELEMMETGHVHTYEGPMNRCAECGHQISNALQQKIRRYPYSD